MNKKLSGQCPCGYFFGAFDDVRDAIVNVRFHFDFYHKDFLPFGITDAEALAMLKKGILRGKKSSLFKQCLSHEAKPKNCSTNCLISNVRQTLRIS